MQMLSARATPEKAEGDNFYPEKKRPSALRERSSNFSPTSALPRTMEKGTSAPLLLQKEGLQIGGGSKYPSLQNVVIDAWAPKSLPATSPYPNDNRETR